MSTEGAAAPPVGRTSLPEPLSSERLASVPGVLGQIARERAGDYAGTESLVSRLARADRTVSLRLGTALTSDGARPAGATRLAVIAEVKRSSPSQGAIA